ncbi:MAG TPA: hypothetical protein VNF29_09740 [Candidatus Binataceae bacterium]|nr:hypothetical protein [Candidatus Binataceae bacterium]
MIRATIVEADELAPSARGAGGFGHIDCSSLPHSRDFSRSSK